MNKWLELLIGLILVIIPVIFWISNIWGFGTAAIELLKGSLIWGVLFLGILLVLLGISDLRN